MCAKEYKRSPAERAYFKRRGRMWRSKNPEKARKISCDAQRKYRTKMKARGCQIRLVGGKWKWVRIMEAAMK